MRICIVTETYWPEVNGVAMTLRRWVDGLVLRGHTIQLIAPHHPDRNATLGADIEHAGVHSIPMPGYPGVRIGLPAPRLISRLWDREPPDVVYVATEGPVGSSAISIANRRKIRVISGYHTNFHSYAQHYWFRFLSPWVERKLVKLHNRTKSTIVPTTWQRDMLEAMGIREVDIIGRGVDTALFSPAARSENLRRQWGAGEDDLVMVLVGRIAEEKNLDLTLAAYKSMLRLAPTLKFVMVGDGPARARIHQQHPDIIMAGVQTGDALAAHYASADLFVFSSKTETFGNVVLEAMASGLGLVAFDYAAASQHVTDGQNGLLAPFDDNAALIDAARRIVTSSEMRHRLRLAARGYALTQRWDDIVADLESVLSGRPRALDVARGPSPKAPDAQPPRSSAAA